MLTSNFIRTCICYVSCIGRWFLTTCANWEAHCIRYIVLINKFPRKHRSAGTLLIILIVRIREWRYDLPCSSLITVAVKGNMKIQMTFSTPSLKENITSTFISLPYAIPVFKSTSKGQVCYCNKCLEGGEYLPTVLVEIQKLRNLHKVERIAEVIHHEFFARCGISWTVCWLWRKRGLKSTAEGIDISDEKHSEGKCKWYSRRGKEAMHPFYWLLCCTKNKLITSTFIFYIIDYFKGCDSILWTYSFVFSEIICDPPCIPNGVQTWIKQIQRSR